MPADNERNYLDEESDQKRLIISPNVLFIFQWNIELFFATLNIFGSVLFAIFTAIHGNMLMYLIKRMIDNIKKTIDDDPIKKP